MTRCILTTPYFRLASQTRNAELEFCLAQNLKNQNIDKIILLTDTKITDKIILENPKIIIKNTKCRPTYQNAISVANYYKKKLYSRNKTILLICNSDIYFKDDDILDIDNRLTRKNAITLSRWNHIEPESNLDSDPTFELYEHWDSQDTWVFLNYINRGYYDFEFGIPGCDNRFAYELNKVGYTLINPAKTIKSRHLHLTNIRMYSDTSPRIPEPYLYVSVTE